tara:strand:+ start:6487 stop:8682 length:2196 start_codon:yes stop_codon:yes gene_type:complete
MKKIIYSFFLVTLSLLVFLLIYLSSIGIETSKFNNIIINEVKKKEPNIQLSLNKIKIKFDIKKIQIYLSTIEPQITYQGIKIPIIKINLYSRILAILKSKNEINQAIISLENFKTKDIQKLAVRIKPSNFKNYLLNNLNNGEVEKIFIDIKFDKNLKIDDYKINGSVKEIDLKVIKDFAIQNVGFNFISDKNLTIINSISANYQGILISNGSVNLNKGKEIEIEGKFNSKFNLDKDEINKLFTKSNIKFLNKNKVNVQGSLLNKFVFKIDKNFKLVDYNYKSSGEISEGQIILKDAFKSSFVEKKINKLLISKTNLTIDFSKKNNILIFDGLYNLGGSDNKKFKVTHDLNKKNSKYIIDLDLVEDIVFKLINFKTNHEKNSNIKSEIEIINNNIVFNHIKFTEGNSLISVNNLKLNNKKEIDSISSIDVLTFNKNKENNNFKITFKDKISVIGEKYDSTYLLKQLSEEGTSSPLKNFTKKIEIKLKRIITKSLIPLSNFNLIGRIKNGKFEKLLAKSQFSEDEYLDISLKKDENNKKILEIYSDSPKALLNDYKFFKGISGGKLLYTSVFDSSGSASQISIEKFKITKAPAFAKLLTLADLGGIADLLSGEGMSFDSLEINTESNKNVIKIKEILALGPSISVLIDGYTEKKSGLISLSGTLVPAKTLNKLISKIPVVGNILVGNKAGEGVFGVSFKMKGLPGKIKTTVNPVKTITPRFITRALEKMKKEN